MAMMLVNVSGKAKAVQQGRIIADCTFTDRRWVPGRKHEVWIRELISDLNRDHMRQLTINAILNQGFSPALRCFKEPLFLKES